MGSAEIRTPGSVPNRDVPWENSWMQPPCYASSETAGMQALVITSPEG